MMKGDRAASLVELLIVILLLAILAAISVVIFLAQREKGYVAQTKSALTHAATAMEAYGTSHDGSYEFATLDDLAKEGLRYPDEISLLLDPLPDATTYCIVASHSLLSDTSDWKLASYNNLRGAPSDEDACLIPGRPPHPRPSPKNSPKK